MIYIGYSQEQKDHQGKQYQLNQINKESSKETMCLYSKLTLNKKYTANKKNGGIIPAVSDKRTLYVPRKCGKCIECMNQKSREWLVRLSEHIKNNNNGKFITLTFSNESIQKLTTILRDEADDPFELQGYKLDNEIATLGMRRFLERWRKEFDKSVTHWFVTELGHENTENIHLHGIVWTNESTDTIEKHWQYGFIHRGKPIWKKGKIIGYENYTNQQSIAYITKYVSKIDMQHQYYRPIILNSPGIGNQYTQKLTHTISCIDRTIHRNNKGIWQLRWYTTKTKKYYSSTWNSTQNKYNPNGTNESYKTTTGHKIALPIYYRNKIYSEEEREKLWIEKLDSNTRWICGDKVDITNGLDDYWNILKYHQQRNDKLKYGNDKANWKREEYEHQIRILKQMARNATETKKLL